MHAGVTAREGPYTWDDLLALDDEDQRELVDGDLVEIEMPIYVHERIAALLVARLHPCVFEELDGP